MESQKYITEEQLNEEIKKREFNYLLFVLFLAFSFIWFNLFDYSNIIKISDNSFIINDINNFLKIILSWIGIAFCFWIMFELNKDF